MWWVVRILIALLSIASYGQELIMSQPSADVVAMGHYFVRSDTFYTQSPVSLIENLNVAYGLIPNLEVSLNGTNVLTRFPTSGAVVAGFKYITHKSKYMTIYVGHQVIQPLDNLPRGNLSYQATAITVGNFRITTGAFQSVNAVAPGERTGAIGGIEWTKQISKNWMVGPAVDYASGAGTNGYTSIGLNIMAKKLMISPGYMIANPKNPNGAHQSFVMVGYTF